MSQKDAEKLVHAFVTLRLDYCISVLSGCSSQSLKTLQLIQNADVGLLTRSNIRGYISHILASLHWLPVKSRIEFKILLPTFKAFNGQALAYLKELKVQSFTLQRGTRQGCPLSPSFVIILIEQPAAVNRQNAHINGIQTLNAHRKISLSATDKNVTPHYQKQLN